LLGRSYCVRSGKSTGRIPNTRMRRKRASANHGLEQKKVWERKKRGVVWFFLATGQKPGREAKWSVKEKKD